VHAVQPLERVPIASGRERYVWITCVGRRDRHRFG